MAITTATTTVWRKRRGAVLLLVLLAVTIAMIAGLTFLARSETTTDAAVVVDDNANARQIAESGLEMAIAYFERTPAWRDEKSEGAWVDDLDLFGGTLDIDATFAPSPGPDTDVDDPSFEDETATLPTPLLNPPMSGTIGEWTFTRTALVETGPTVPDMGTRNSADATDGVNEAFISFGATVTGTATISQDLGFPLEAQHEYELVVDMSATGLPPLDASFGFRLYAGSTLVATTEEAYVLLTPPESWEELQQDAEDLLNQAQEPATLVTNLLGGSTYEFTLRFVTDAAPPPGNVSVEMFAESVGLVNTMAFDNVRFQALNNSPLTLTASARSGSASHRAVAIVARQLSGAAQILEWEEP